MRVECDFDKLVELLEVNVLILNNKRTIKLLI